MKLLKIILRKLKNISFLTPKILKIVTVSSKLNHRGAKTIKDPFKKNFNRFKLDFLMGTPQQSSFPKWYAAITKNEINAKAGKKNQTKITIRAKKI